MGKPKTYVALSKVHNILKRDILFDQDPSKGNITIKMKKRFLFSTVYRTVYVTLILKRFLKSNTFFIKTSLG